MNIQMYADIQMYAEFCDLLQRMLCGDKQFCVGDLLNALTCDACGTCDA